jgi:hypothetical protein
MKRGWLTGTAVVVLMTGLVLVLHMAHVLPLPAAPPYLNGDQIWITPKNPWTW